MSSPSAPYQGMSDLALLLVGPCLEIGGPGMYPPVADLMYLSSVTAGDLDLESRKMGSVKVCPNDQMILTLHFLRGSLTSCSPFSTCHPCSKESN